MPLTDKGKKVLEGKYYPVLLFRAKCFAKTPIHVIFGKHYVASWEDRLYKTARGAINFAEKQIVFWALKDVFQLPGAKFIDAEN